MPNPHDPSAPPSKSPEPSRGDGHIDGDGAHGHTRGLLYELQIHQFELETQNREMREAQGMLEESRARYVELYDRSPVGYLTLDRSGVIREINLTGASLLGKERVRLLESPLGPLLARESRLAFRAHLERCFQERGGKSSVELRVARREGPAMVLELTSAVFTDASGIPQSNSVLTDVSERRRAEAERALLLAQAEEARALAEQASRVREDFLAVVSHELRTPLAPMLMWMGILRRPQIEPVMRGHAIDMLDSCLKAQIRVIDDLVDIARITSGTLHVEPRPMRFGPLVQSAVEAFRAAAMAKNIELEAVIDASVESSVIAGDPIRLNQVLVNLLGNAVKFTSERGRVKVALARRDDQVILSVEDDGEGISESLLPHIFEPFHQQDGGSARRHGGLGLGLYIVRQLVERHGGAVSATSAGARRGATLTVSLPLLDACSHATGTAPEAGDHTEEPPRGDALRGARVLVVEDQRETREALIAYLAGFGAEVAAVDSARAARGCLQESKVDILVCDIAMPDEDGHRFIRSLREREGDGARLPAVALTAHVAAKAELRALEAGFDLHLAKPIPPERLVRALASLLQRTGKLARTPRG